MKQLASAGLASEQLDLLTRELYREELSIYTVVVMARRDCAAGRYTEAIARLRIDSDKIRMHSIPLFELISVSQEINRCQF